MTEAERPKARRPQAKADEAAIPAQDDSSGVLEKITKAADDVEQQDARTREQHRALGERLHVEALRAQVYSVYSGGRVLPEVHPPELARLN